MRYAATVESLIAKWDEPQNFAFEIGPIIHHGINANGTEYVHLTFGDINYHRTIMPIYASNNTERLKETAVKMHMNEKNSAYNAMMVAVKSSPKKPHKGKMFNSLDEALISTELEGFDPSEIKVVELGQLHKP